MKQFNLSTNLDAYLSKKHFDDYTEIQIQAIPKLLKSQSILAEAPTGSGKTLAFLLPIIKNLNFTVQQTQAIIFVPTRELGKQIYQVVKEIQVFEPNFTVGLFLGGEEKIGQEKKLARGPQIIIANPSRLNKLIANQSSNLSALKYLIVDEVDMLFNFGAFEDVLEFLIKNKINKKQLTFGFFSSTFSISLQNYLLKNIGSISANNIIVKTNPDKPKIIINTISTNLNSKLTDLMKLINASYFNPFFAIIFTKTNQDAEAVYSFLRQQNLKNLALFTTNLNQRERNKVIKLINIMDTQILVASDLISRGMDFPMVSHVINYTLPTDLAYFQHRIGRANRGNDLSGQIYCLIDNDEKLLLQKLVEKYPQLSFKKFKI